MDDELSRKLDSLLNSPDSMDKIRDMMKTLGLSDQPTSETPPAEDNGMMSGLLSLAPLLGSLGQDDQNTTLLKALRPYLHGDREKRLDESLKLMQLLKFLPLLQQKGGLFG